MKAETLLFSILVVTGVVSFAPPTVSSYAKDRRSLALWAKKARRKPKKESSSSGGFGVAAAQKTPKSVDDYSVFPRLEPGVMETLVPSLDASTFNTNTLPGEIYQRLDQIYGLPLFNYDTVDQDESQESLTDLLSSGTSSASSSSSSLLGNLMGETTTSMGSSELDDLLNTATGGSTTKSASSSPSSSPSLSLEELPPFSGIRILHTDPLVLAVDEFFTDAECDRYIEMSAQKKGDVMESRSPTVGKDATAKAQRTSTTWYHHYRNVPELMSKASRLLGLDTIDRWEEPQTVRYRRNEKFTWHLDALGPSENQPKLGGQRTATLLVYLTDLGESEGGATMFRDLGGNQPLRVRPKKGSALLFFPAAGGIPDTPFDIRTLHCGEVVSEDASNDKWISQLWLRESSYSPTAPPGNDHGEAIEAINEYCASHRK